MALSLSQTLALSNLLKPGMKIASLGYPDMIAPEELIKKFSSGYEYRGDSEAICGRHGLSPRPIPDAVSVFQRAECELVVYDIVQERGCEVLCDLNKPFNFYRHRLGTFDIVLDVGTAEHVLNIGEALINMASLVKVGGHILHENPHSGWTNHGFYSLHPTLFYDFYTSNGFEIINLMLTSRNGDCYGCHPTKRMKIGDLRDVNVFCMAKKFEQVSFRFPQQSKYS